MPRETIVGGPTAKFERTRKAIEMSATWKSPGEFRRLKKWTRWADTPGGTALIEPQHRS